MSEDSRSCGNAHNHVYWELITRWQIQSLLSRVDLKTDTCIIERVGRNCVSIGNANDLCIVVICHEDCSQVDGPRGGLSESDCIVTGKWE